MVIIMKKTSHIYIGDVIKLIKGEITEEDILNKLDNRQKDLNEQNIVQIQFTIPLKKAKKLAKMNRNERRKYLRGLLDQENEQNIEIKNKTNDLFVMNKDYYEFCNLLFIYMNKYQQEILIEMLEEYNNMKNENISFEEFLETIPQYREV